MGKAAATRRIVHGSAVASLVPEPAEPTSLKAGDFEVKEMLVERDTSHSSPGGRI